MTKTAEKPYPWGRTYLYSTYKGVPPGSPSYMESYFELLCNSNLTKNNLMGKNNTLQYIYGQLEG